jgi:hypothetical protein
VNGNPRKAEGIGIGRNLFGYQYSYETQVSKNPLGAFTFPN